MFGWYLFLGESFTDHPWNYEVFFGCRVIPILGAIGRNLDVLQTVEGFVERARSVATTERSQPNAGLFEILVAAAYARAGWKVRFKPVQRGIAKTYDLDAEKGRRRLAIECKRMEGGEYHEAERALAVRARLFPRDAGTGVRRSRQGVPVPGGVCRRGSTKREDGGVGMECASFGGFAYLGLAHLIEPVATCTPAAGWEKGQVENQVGNLRDQPVSVPSRE